MQVAGIRRVGAPVEMIEVGEPRPLADEMLLKVEAAGGRVTAPVDQTSKRIGVWRALAMQSQ